MMRLMASSIAIANRAGQIIREVMTNGELGIIEKVCFCFCSMSSIPSESQWLFFIIFQGKNDYQTEADRSAQRCIVASLTHQFPGVKIIGEEGASDITDIPKDWNVTEHDADFFQNSCPESLRDVSEKDLVIWVDPLDGTSEYTNGYLEHVTVLIGLSVKNRAVGGIIHQPYYKVSENKLGRTIWGLKGLGTGGFKPNTLDDNELIVTTTRSHSNELVQSALQSLQPSKVLRVGGAGYKVLQLLEGKAHAYVFASGGCKKWDTCGKQINHSSVQFMLFDNFFVSLQLLRLYWNLLVAHWPIFAAITTHMAKMLHSQISSV